LAWLRAQPYWRDVVVLCSNTTPEPQLDRLRRHHVEYVVAGTNRVDLPTALRMVAERYGVTAVRVDAGGTLNGQLLRAGLVDEIDLVVAPYLAGTGEAHPVHLIDAAFDGGQRLAPIDARQLRDGHLRLRYTVSPARASGASVADDLPEDLRL
jgi:2,5-diamino-6-(ribosylamino)-4(3H)-pyrimidinone 5'-phosphate reductase